MDSEGKTAKRLTVTKSRIYYAAAELASTHFIRSDDTDPESVSELDDLE